MSALLRSAARFRRRLAREDTAARARIDSAYADVHRVADRELADLLERLGPDPTITDLYRAAYLPDLLQRVRAEMTRTVPAVEAVVLAETEAAATLARGDAPAALRQAVGEPNLRLATLRPAAVAEAVAHTQTGALRSLRNLPVDAVARIERAVVRGVAMQRGPERVSRDVAAAIDGNRSRARTIARTEMQRVYRETTRMEWLANSDLVQGWEWFASLDDRCCAACIAMHGSIHPLNEPMAAHANCRCQMLPVTGREAAGSLIEDGPTQFARWPHARQLEAVGPGKLAAIRGRRITLPDLVAERDHPVWGRSVQVASLPDALANAARRRSTRALAA